ncbi:MAG: enterochelin esterase [Oscillospiraceae bacterium]|nr:enterochelin esterase [Oscillospiraceae bacterium]
MSMIEYEPIPDVYRFPAVHQGRMESFFYNNASEEKQAWVYLPYGYDDTDDRYDIIYMMHGGSDNSTDYLGTADEPNELKTAIDHLIENGEIKPVIIVMPTFYPNGTTDVGVDNSYRLVKLFPDEFTDHLMPAVEGKYRTFAKSTDKKGLCASREHRAFGGFSMGGVTTWYIFLQCMRYVRTFIPESGDCWYFGRLGGKEYRTDTAKLLSEAVGKQGFTADDIRIFAATGSDDIAYPQLDAQIEEMKKYPDTFLFDKSDRENLTYMVAKGCTHWYVPVRQYFFDILKTAYKP